MANISPSPDSAPSGVPPTSSTPPPLPSPSNPALRPNANPPDPSTPSTPPDAVPPSNSGSTPVTAPPVASSPPPTASAPPPTTPVSPPPTSETPPPVNSPPPVTSVSPPPSQTGPPAVSSPPPANAPPPTPSPPADSPPPTSTPTPPSSTPPPTSTPTPPSSDPPNSAPPPPPSSETPPVGSPPPPSSTPPESSPPPPPSTSPPPQSSPSPPAVPPPKDSPPSSGDSPPPSGSKSAPPPSVIPGTPPALRPPPSSRTPPSTVPSPPGLPGNKSSSDAAQTVNAPSGGGNGSNASMVIGVVAGVVILGLIGLIAIWMYKRKKRSPGANDGHVIPASMGSSPRSDIKLLVKTEHPPSHFGGGSVPDTPTDHGGFGHSRSWFTYQELSEATGGFSDENLLGEGGFGCVYKGLLTDGRVIAVKQLKIGGGQGEREFKAEVEIISRIHHRHLVSLVGYCIWESKRLLVYEFVPKDTLHFHLHGAGTPVMDWSTRVKIAAGAARGIAYLHEDCHPRIIHRDIKSSNILLDNNFEARVSDFGLAKLAMDADTHVSTRVMGTFGYMAPEYATSGKLTEKSDVYSFGVVLLELITGRKPVDESQPLGDESLVEWARPLLTQALETGEFEAVVDPRLEKNYIESEMFRMVEAAAACVRHSAAKRPRMGQVVRAFSISDSGDLSNGLRVGESQIYDSAQQSAEIRWFRRMAFGSQDISSDNFGQSAQNSTQNIGFSTQSRQSANVSTQHGQGGNISRQHSQDAQKHDQGVNIPRQQTQDSQILGFSSQSGSSGDSSADHGLGSNVSRQQSHNTYRSAQRNQNFSNQGGQNMNFYRNDNLNR